MVSNQVKVNEKGFSIEPAERRITKVEPWKLFLKILAVLASIEYLIMFSLHGVDAKWTVVVDPIILSFFSAPFIYWWVIRKVILQKDAEFNLFQTISAQQSKIKDYQEEAARQKYEKMMLDHLPTGLLMISGDERVLSVNLSFQAMFATTQETDWIGQPMEWVWKNIGVGNRLQDWKERLDVPIEIRLLNDEERFLQIMISSLPYQDSHKLEHRMMVVIEDITTRKKAEETLWSMNEKMVTVIESSPLAIAVLDLDQKVQVWNPAAEEIFQWKKEEILNLPYPIVPEKSKEWTSEIFLSGKRLVNHEVKRLRKDGTLVDISLSTAPLRNSEGVHTGILAILQDISERKRTSKQLEDQKFALDISSIVSITDANGVITYANEEFCQISKYSLDELIGRSHRILNSGYHPESFFKQLWETVREGGVWKGEVRNQAKDGSIFWVDTTIVPFSDNQGIPYQYVVIRNDITERKSAQEAIEHMAFHDDLTDLPNRRLFKQRLTNEIKRVKGTDKRLATIFLDLNGFNQVNDSYGHSYGDELIIQVSRRLQQCVDSDHFLSRFGGDEFALLFSNIHSESQIEEKLQDILNLFEQPFFIDHHEIHISASMGISLYPSDGEDAETLIKNADTAMYHVKKEGTNHHYVFYSSTMFEKTTEQLWLQNQLHGAIDREELSLYYQPQVDLSSGKIVGVEALLRWNHPEVGFISPAKFIPVAEETGLIIPIGKWVLKTACDQNKKWQKEGYPRIRIAVNISPIQFKQGNIVETVREIIEKSDLDPTLLELEITEGVGMYDTQFTIQTLQQLKDLGVRISIDDFGTGYCSLTYLRKFSIDALKIDQSFVRDIGIHQDELVSTIIHMSHNFGLKVIAEGIETKEQQEYLEQHHCDEGQGYLFSKPMPAKKLEELWTTMGKWGKK